MESPPAEPIKVASSQAFEQTAMGYRAQVDTIQARDIAKILFESI
jgi:hypothetical protein